MKYRSVSYSGSERIAVDEYAIELLLIYRRFSWFGPSCIKTRKYWRISNQWADWDTDVIVTNKQIIDVLDLSLDTLKREAWRSVTDMRAKGLLTAIDMYLEMCGEQQWKLVTSGSEIAETPVQLNDGDDSCIAAFVNAKYPRSAAQSRVIANSPNLLRFLKYILENRDCLMFNSHHVLTATECNQLEYVFRHACNLAERLVANGTCATKAQIKKDVIDEHEPNSN